MFDFSRILITGSSGFLGHHVKNTFEDYAMHPDRDIVIITPSRKELNLLDRAGVDQYLKNYRPDIIIHLAAQCGGIGINSAKPGEFLYNNLMMTSNLIDAAKDYGKIVKFVGIGTVCSYPKHTPVPFKEENLYNGYPEETNAPYGMAKRMQLDMLKAYRQQYGLNGIFLVPVNMMGEYDNFDDASSHVIPAMLKKFHKAKMSNSPSVTLWGDGSASREFLYAGDCADAILRATILYDKPDPVNIGTGKEITIKQLAKKIKSVVGYNGEIIWDTTKPNGQPRRCLDTSKAKKEFGFEAKSDFDHTLSTTYQWAIKNNAL
jgi:GDP-L-fucose synthase